eukprot:1160057-Pelagomonas_calceolata.AAC.5
MKGQAIQERECVRVLGTWETGAHVLLPTILLFAPCDGAVAEPSLDAHHTTGQHATKAMRGKA